MTRTNVLLMGVVLLAALTACWGIVARRQSEQLRHENAALRQQLTLSSQVATENQRLSNIVAQGKIAQTIANDRYEELIKLRGEFNRLNEANTQSNLLYQAKLADTVQEQVRELASLRQEVASLMDEVLGLREDFVDLTSITPADTTASSDTTAPARAAQPAAAAQPQPQDRAVSIRMINTHAGFAEKLKRSVAAQENESFADVFGRFLQSNGIDTESIAGAGFDDRTGRIIVRGPAALLDLVERATVALDAAPVGQ